MTDWLLALSYFFHLIATVTWIGGLMLMTILIWPEARNFLAQRESNPTMLGFLARFRKRFQVITNLSLFVLIVTGLFQLDKSPNYEGLLQFTNDWSRAILVKHIATVGMIGIGGLMQFGLIPALERQALLASRGKASPEQAERLRARERVLVTVNTGLGMVVLACTAVATAV